MRKCVATIFCFALLTAVNCSTATNTVNGQQISSPAPVQNYVGPDVANVGQHRLLEYRRMFRNGVTPAPHEMTGLWRGANKGIVEIAGYRQFIKDIRPDGHGGIIGDNIQVHQLSKPGQLRLNGWQPKYDSATGGFERQGRFAVQPATGRGRFGHGATFSYADGGNRRNDPANLLVDQVVRINDHQMLGRAVAKFGPIRIPLAYFVLERVQ